MNYRTVEDLSADTRRFAHDLSRDIDLIAGIPRSGLLAANLLCLHLDVPMVDIDGLCRGEPSTPGRGTHTATPSTTSTSGERPPAAVAPDFSS